METEPVDLTRQIQVRFQPEFDGTYSRIHKGTLNGSHASVKYFIKSGLLISTIYFIGGSESPEGHIEEHQHDATG